MNNTDPGGSCLRGAGSPDLPVMGARRAGCETVVAVDLDAATFDLARWVGASDVAVGEESDGAIRDLTRGGTDYAFEAAGHPEALGLADAATPRGGTTVGIGLPHPDQRYALPAPSLVAEERPLVGSYMG